MGGREKRSDPVPGWLLLSPEVVPERWRGRAVGMSLVPLTPPEANRILRGEPAVAELGPEDEPLLALLAGGISVRELAERLGISQRGLQHRLARLRRRFGVSSTRELALLAARRGFARETEVKRNAKGGRVPSDE